MGTIITIPGSPRPLGGDEVFVIAEIGKNFIQTEEDRPISEYLENAKALVLAAKESGVDAVKFQTHEVEDEVLNIDFTSPHFKAKDRYSWVTRNMQGTPMDTFWKPLKAYCDELDILFFSTPMSRKAACKLELLDVPLWKVGSGDVQDYVLMDYLASTQKPVIISSGMVSFEELRAVVSHNQSLGIPLAVLYCISQYPCPPEMFNLSTIERMREEFPDVVIGFSDHSITHDASIRALKMGARIIEKHFSFSRELWGSDHKASVLPEEMKELVRIARTKEYEGVDVDAFYGEKEKELEGASNVHRPFFNKGLMAGCDIEEGTILTYDMLFAMRPVSLCGGAPSQYAPDMVGKRVTKSLKKYDPLTLDILV